MSLLRVINHGSSDFVRTTKTLSSGCAALVLAKSFMSFQIKICRLDIYLPFVVDRTFGQFVIDIIIIEYSDMVGFVALYQLLSEFMYLYRGFFFVCRAGKFVSGLFFCGNIYFFFLRHL